MKLLIDTDAQTLTEDDGKEERTVPLYSREAFEAISDAWVKVGWNEGYSYTFSWFGRPIIQLPEDMVRTQEVVHRVRPDVIVETGVAHGGSAIYSAALFAGMGADGRVCDIDIDIRPHNREAIEGHPLSDRVTLVEGSSTDTAIVA